MLTAFGVFQAMRAAAEHTWGAPTLHGKRVAVEGVGKVGHHLVEHLLEDGASVVVSDVNEAALDAGPGSSQRCVASSRSCRGSTSTSTRRARWWPRSPTTSCPLKARVVCGAANNQLQHPGVEKQLADRGILYTPDYVANAGGLIQVADEALSVFSGGFSFERAKQKATGDLRHDATDLPARRRRGAASRRRGRPGRRAAGWPTSAGFGPSCCPGGPSCNDQGRC